MTHMFNFGNSKFLALITRRKDETIDIEYLDLEGKVEKFKLGDAFEESFLTKLKNLVRETVVYRDSDGFVKLDQVESRDKFCYIMKDSGDHILVDRCSTLEEYQSACHVGDNIGIRLSYGKEKLVCRNGVIIGEYERYICAIELQSVDTIRIAYIPRHDIVPPNKYQSLFEDVCTFYKYDPKKIITGIETKETLIKSTNWHKKRQITSHKFLPDRVKITQAVKKVTSHKDDDLQSTTKKQRDEIFDGLMSFLIMACIASFYYYKYSTVKSSTYDESECTNEHYSNYSC